MRFGTSSHRKAALVAFAASFVAFVPSTNWADAGSKAAAESLFQEARKLVDEKRYADACPKFAESHRLDPTLGTLLNLARCHELEGKTATAWAEYLEVSRSAKGAGQAERATTAQKLADALAPKLAKLRIEAPNAPIGIVIERDGVVVGPGALGTFVSVDPGGHEVVASAPGYEKWSSSFVVDEGPSEKTVVVSVLEKATRGHAGSKPASGRFVGGLVIGGVGVAALGAGAVFGALTLRDASNASSDPNLCPEKRCTPAGRAVIDAAETKALVSTIGVAAGISAIGVGMTLVLLSRQNRKETAQEGAFVRFGLTGSAFGGGLEVRGVF